VGRRSGGAWLFWTYTAQALHLRWAVGVVLSDGLTLRGNRLFWLATTHGARAVIFRMFTFGIMGEVDPLAALAGGAGFLVLLVVFWWPDRGVYARWRRWRRFSMRVLEEDALKHLYKAELQGARPTLQSVAGTLGESLGRAADVLVALQERKWVQVLGQEIKLLPAGRRYALNIVRAHRLWEQHLAEQTGISEADWHRLAEMEEHRLSPSEVDDLSARLGHPAYDPHGDPIPTSEGEFAPGGGRPLGMLDRDGWGVVWHVEDEPESVYAQVRAIGLYPGTMVRLLESSDRHVRIWANGEEHVLAPVVAANVSVQVAAPREEEESGSVPLSALGLGQSGRIQRLSRRCRGAERRRLLDFGLLPGTLVSAEMLSPAGNLTAYRVRDTLIALRREQAANIQVIVEEVS
jgi:DtxR family Mn-dependent transcriptional regulator